MENLEHSGSGSAARAGRSGIRLSGGALAELERFAAPLIVVVLLLLWELAASQRWISALFFPAPSVIARTLWRELVSGDLLPQIGLTLMRLLIGFGAGACIGLALGLLMGWQPRIRRVLQPFISAIQPLPKISVLPLIMVIFGIGETSRLIVIGLGTFFPVLINTITGVREIAPLHLEVAQSCGASRRLLFTRVILPGALPIILSGIVLGMNMALTITLVTEIVYAQAGLGAMIWMAWQTFRTEELYAALIVIGILGISIHHGVRAVTIRLMPWQRHRK